MERIGSAEDPALLEIEYMEAFNSWFDEENEDFVDGYGRDANWWDGWEVSLDTDDNTSAGLEIPKWEDMAAGVVKGAGSMKYGVLVCAWLTGNCNWSCSIAEEGCERTDCCWAGAWPSSPPVCPCQYIGALEEVPFIFVEAGKEVRNRE